jgi:Histidinol-phosphate/aromatic aminotransferase and cobyric acid decarboxylase
MMRIFASVSGLNVTPICGADLAKAFSRAKAQIIYLCSPNNPTGGVIDADVIGAIVESAPGIVIIDEAYIDFGGESSVGLLDRFDNVLITRTLSKAFGLAGFRVGYGVGSPAIACQVEAARGPYKVSGLSERVAIEVFANDGEWIRQHVDLALDSRRRFAIGLSSLGLEPLDSSANFLLVPVTDAAQIEARLRARSVAVRAFTNLTGIGDALRITVGPWDSMQLCSKH